MPIFSKVFDTRIEFNPTKVFFVTYETDDNSEDEIDAKPMKYHYSALNDIVFFDKVFQFGKRANVFTSLVPY